MLIKTTKKNQLPLRSFKKFLWSYNFSKIDPNRNSKAIIVNTINYGDLVHWQWLVRYYGKKKIVEKLTQIQATELRPASRRLASLIFNIKKFNYAPRSARQKR